jgi:hypothetical protein
MTRSVALRSSLLFGLIMLASLLLGLGSKAQVAEALFLVAASLGAVLAFVGTTMPSRAAVPVRVRDRRRPRG